MRRALSLAILALATAAVITIADRGEPFAEHLVRAEAADALPHMAAELEGESAAVNAVFLAYADDPELTLSARLAHRRYPAMTREILPLYGLTPEFRTVLARHGPAALPPIHYFLTHEIRSLAVRAAAGEAADGLRKAAAWWWQGSAADSRPAAAGLAERAPLTAEARGWYAVKFIQREGHDFLGQFAVTPDGGVAWMQAERALEGAASFFAGGVRSLESRLRVEGTAEASDYLWAGVDVALITGAAKLLRAGRVAGTAARTGHGTGSATRAALAARTVGQAGRSALRIGKYGAPLAIGYAVFRHPGLISSMAAAAAGWLGVPAWSVQVLVWTVLLLPLAWLVHGLWRRLVRPAAWLLLVSGHGLRRIAPRP